MNRIITVGRQFGSGGRELGKRLAEQMGIAYYDKEIIEGIAKKSGMAEEYVSNVLSGRVQSCYPIMTGQTFTMPYSFMPEISVMTAQRELLLELGAGSDCVIVGRCADYILKDMKPCRIFVYADIEERAKRCRQRAQDSESFTDAELVKKIKAIDKSRAEYYEYYSGVKWGAKENYDLCINTCGVEIKSIVPMIMEFVRLKSPR